MTTKAKNTTATRGENGKFETVDPMTIARSKPFGEFSRFRIDTFQTRFNTVVYFLVDVENSEETVFGPFDSEEDATKKAARIVLRDQKQRQDARMLSMLNAIDGLEIGTKGEVR